MMRVVMMMVLVCAAFGLAACETVKGVGKDVTNAGEAIDRTF